ncbi:hypothetical protein ALQ29_03310 [Pseudomonas marginalis pv. marginalis]|uniref:Uncharacterized protein n=1 Tax=Pseudomonas marginalis pv. marginalis TaxID=97473 RepID=A0A3M4B849_PSEMA|nr:hypothetical protein ALQ29_03310 [Pseudomonas marginalis pv. marginalis]
MQQQALADFAGQVAALEHRADGAAAEFVELLGGNAELAAFADGDHEGGGFQRFGANAFYNQFHFRVPYKGLLAKSLYSGFNTRQLCKPPVTKAAV